jgi:hypothetical protein
MRTRELTTERKILEPIVGSKVGVYNALQTLKRQHTDLVPIEYPHEIAQGQWRTVVSVPNTTPRKVTVQRGTRLSFSVDRRAAAYVAGGATAVAAVVGAVWVVVSAISWAVGVIASIIGVALANWEMIAVIASIVAICAGGGAVRACTHADHH